MRIVCLITHARRRLEHDPSRSRPSRSHSSRCPPVRSRSRSSRRSRSPHLPRRSSHRRRARSASIPPTSTVRSARRTIFFRFVNGGWIKRTAIPSDAPRWGTFDELDERSREAMHAILEEAARSNAPAGSEERKVGDFYASFMDSARVESLGVTPLKDELARIAAIRRCPPLARRVRAPRATRRRAALRRQRRPRSEEVVGEHRARRPVRARPPRSRLLSDAGRADEHGPPGVPVTTSRACSRSPSIPIPTGAAPRVLALETAMAGKQWDRVRNRDRDATYNQHDGHRARREDAALRLDDLLLRHGTRRAVGGHRRSARLPRRRRLAARRHAGRRRGASISPSGCSTRTPTSCPSPFVQARIRLPRQGAHRPAGDARALEARRGRGRTAGSARRPASSTSRATSSRRRRRAWTR